MKKKQFYLVAAIFFSAIAVIILLLFTWNHPQKTVLTDTGKKQETHGTSQQKQEKEKEQKPYLSITYTTADASVKPSGRMIHFYTYDLESGQLEEQAQIPFSSQYALGMYHAQRNKIYYTYREVNEIGNGDHLYEYDLSNKAATQLEDIGCAYNDIIQISDSKLLVTTKQTHAMGTAVFDLDTHQFSYLFPKKMNSDGYKDFLQTTRPAPLNYNYRYGTFINISASEKALYSGPVMDGTKKLRYRIALVDKDLNILSECTFKSLLGREISAIAQVAPDKAIARVFECGFDYDKTEFFEFDFTRHNYKQIDSPFPKMSIVNNFITVDDGKSYYVKGTRKKGVSGLFYYDCVTNTVTPILLDGEEEGDVSHVVNFCLTNG